MTSKKIVMSIAYAAVGVQLATYLANDIGRLSKGPLYWTLLYTAGITLLGAVVWLIRLRSRSQHSPEAQ